MWYIVKTDFYKEQEAIKDLLLLDGIEEVYFPQIRQELPAIGGTTEKPVRFRPVISGVLFVYAKGQELLEKHLDFRGYFLKEEMVGEGTTSSAKHRPERVIGNAHLFPLESEPERLEDMLRHAEISDEEIYRYKVCVEQCAAHTEDIKIVGKNYGELLAENDLVLITDGPFVGFTGVIKQVKTGGVKDRCLFFSLGSFCVRLSGIRRFGVIIVRESAKGTKAQLPNTWRYIDFLIGKLQASYFADTASAALRHILECYNKVKDIEQCQDLLLDEANRQRSEAESREMALQSVWLRQVGDKELGALKSLRRFFQSDDNSMALALIDLIPDMSLRPFLTPTSGVELPKSKNYILFPHNGFTELIFRVNLKKEFLKAENYPSLSITDKQEGRYTEDGKLKGKMRKERQFKLSDKEYIYYVHVGLRDREDGKGVVAMVNWGEFLHRYVSLKAEEREAFHQDLLVKGYQETHRLLGERSASIVDDTQTQSGFTCLLPHIQLEDIWKKYERSQKAKQLPLSLVRNFYPVCQLVRSCIPAAVEFWQRQRLLEWRHLVQRYVLLHNLPLE